MQLEEYESGVAVSLNVNAPAGVTITAVSYSLFDTDDVALVTDQALNPSDIVSDVLPVTVSALNNTLATSPSREIRYITVQFTDSDSNVYTGEARYIVRSGSSVIRLTNSFGTMNELLLVSNNMPHLTELDAVTEDVFIGNAIEAWKRLSRLYYRYRIFDANVDALSYLIERRDGYMYIKDITQLSQSEYDALPAEMKNALIRAQVTEMAELIGGDVGDVQAKRDAGIISETIGESKQFFNARPPLKLPVSRKSLIELEGYFYWKNTIARV